MRRRSNAPSGRVLPANARSPAAPFLAVLSLVVFSSILPGHGAQTTGTDQGASRGKAAPDFALTDLSGKTVRLSDFKGKVVLLDFWATWCAPCREEIPKLIQLQKQYSSKGFTVLGVALDEEGAAAVKPVAKKLNINYPVVAGNSKVAAAYGGIQALPTAFLIGRDGRIVKTYDGSQKRSTFQQDIRSALRQAGGASAQSHTGQVLQVRGLLAGRGEGTVPTARRRTK